MTETTKSWGETQGPQTPERREVERLKIPVNGSVVVRLVGNVLPRYVYWVTTSEGKRMPQECLEFDRQTEAFKPEAPNPFKEIGEEIFNDKAQFAYICNVIDREDGKVKLLDLKRTIYGGVCEYARNPEYGNPADEVKGYDITIKKDKTGPLPQNVKYSIMPGRESKPLTDEEKELELYDLEKMYVRPTYDDQKTWLIQNTAYFAGTEGTEFAGESAEDID